MPVTDQSSRSAATGVGDPLVVVSSDCHIGPRLVEDLRPYCPSKLLDEFDAYVERPDRSRGRFAEAPDGALDGELVAWRNLFIDGHHDPTSRRRDLDFDGVAGEVIFHGSQNNEPIPFQMSVFKVPDDREVAAAGLRIYNRWLADYCADAPHRHVGLAHLPLWDVDAAVAELRWARDAGLRGVNFPAPRPGIEPYNSRSWEPFWAAVAELEMPLTTHAGAGNPDDYTGPETVALLSIESGGWMSRRAIHRMIFAGVFERHPGVHLVMTEQPGQWWPYTMNELDSVYLANGSNRELREQVPRRPSEYMASNVWIGGSFLSRAEAEGAIRDGYADRVLWGSDYPHMEGTYQYPPHGDFDALSYTKASLRHTFAGLPDEPVSAMLGLNAAQVYGLDTAALKTTADRIGALTFDDISQPLDEIPEGASPFAFRTFGPWA